jgi:hypothetical protein
MDDDAEFAALSSAWTPTETWIWEQNAKGLVADLASTTLPTPLSCDAATWTDAHRVRASFIEDSMTRESLRKRLSRRGLRMAHALVLEKLNLGEAALVLPLRLDHCRLAGGADLAGVRASRTVSFEDCTFVGDVTITNGRIEGGLILRRSKLSSTFDGRGLACSADERDMPV